MKCFVTPSRLKESQHSQNVITKKKKMKLYDCSKIHLYLISNCFEKKTTTYNIDLKLSLKSQRVFQLKVFNRQLVT